MAKRKEKRTYTKYPEEKQRQIAEFRYLEIKTKVELAKEYKISKNAIAVWEKKFFGGSKKTEELTEQDKEIMRLKKFLKEKEEDIEF